MNEKEKPEECAVTDCSNKCYGRNYLMLDTFEWVCRRHYFDFNYGITDYPRTTVRSSKREDKVQKKCK